MVLCPMLCLLFYKYDPKFTNNCVAVFFGISAISAICTEKIIKDQNILESDTQVFSGWDSATNIFEISGNVFRKVRKKLEKFGRS